MDWISLHDASTSRANACHLYHWTYNIDCPNRELKACDAAVSWRHACNSTLLLEKDTRIERKVIGRGLIITLATLYLLSLAYSIFSIIYIVSFLLFPFGLLFYEIWERTVHTVKLKCVAKT